MAKPRVRTTVERGTEDVPLVPTGALAVALAGLTDKASPLVHVARDGRRLDELAATLRLLRPDLTVGLFPEWDCLPYDHASPSRATMGARTALLRWLTDREALPAIVLTTGPALAQRVPPPETWGDARVAFAVGDTIDVAAVTQELQRLGYVLDERVDEPGEVAVRGRTLEVFPAAAPLPCRVEHDKGRVTAIRSYDPSLSARSPRRRTSSSTPRRKSCCGRARRTGWRRSPARSTACHASTRSSSLSSITCPTPAS